MAPTVFLQLKSSIFSTTSAFTNKKMRKQPLTLAVRNFSFTTIKKCKQRYESGKNKRKKKKNQQAKDNKDKIISTLHKFICLPKHNGIS